MSEGVDGSHYGVVADDVEKKKRKRQRRRLSLQLHLVKGRSFFTGAENDASVGPVMDGAVWGKLPEEVLWDIVGLVPAAKHFQWQLVSRRWREVLSSSQFRKTPAQSEQQQQKASVMACVRRPWHRRRSGSKTNCKVWTVGLSTMVPDSFWRNSEDDYEACVSSWSVVAAAEGLVCISTNTECRRNYTEEEEEEVVWEPFKPWANRYCVLNPLTRTCVVLPPLPFQAYRWLPPTSTAIAFLGWSCTNHVWDMATYNLAAAAAATDGTGGSGGWVTTPGGFGDVHSSWQPIGAVLGRETFWYSDDDEKVRVTAPDLGAGSGGRQVVVATLDVPSVALLGLDVNEVLLCVPDTADDAVLVALRGAVFFVGQLEMAEVMRTQSVMCGLWRLARAADGRMDWEGVALLYASELKRLTGFDCVGTFELRAAYAVRDMVCCELFFDGWNEKSDPELAAVACLLGFNVDTGNWEFVHGEKGLMDTKGMELRPDLFLSTCSRPLDQAFETPSERPSKAPRRHG